MTIDLRDLLSLRRGHFQLESGHHGDLWLDLDALFQHPARIAPLIEELGDRLASHAIDAVCGPLTGGAFVAFAIAARRDLQFFPAERFADATGARYRIPASLRPRLAGVRIAIVDDVINAGSAVRGTYADLQSCGADVCALGALAILGPHAARLGLPLERMLALDNTLWPPAECPMCASAVPLEDLAPTAPAPRRNS
jgi:orotate phosphoribosyltransferase